MPDALVLADSAAAGAFEFDSCSCLNPVSVGEWVAGAGGGSHGLQHSREGGGGHARPAWAMLCSRHLATQLTACLSCLGRTLPSQGSLACGTFAAYSPVTREAEVCDVQLAAREEDEMEVEAELVEVEEVEEGA